MKKTIKIILTLLILVGCQTNKKPEYQRYQNTTVTSGFNTGITLLAYTENEAEFNEYFELMKSEFSKYNAIFDIYNDYEGVNNAKMVNDKAGIEPVVVDQNLIDVLLLSKSEYEYTKKKFNPVAGTLLEVWHNYREEGMLLNQNNEPGKVPTTEELNQAAACISWDYLEIDDDKNTLYLTESCASIDLGGIAKGYAVEQVALTLEAKGLKYGIINGGGNVRVINSKPDNSPWVVGIAYPSLIRDKNVELFNISESGSLVTSGDYQRMYQDENNRRLSHLIDMETYMPGFHFRSVTIYTKDSTLGDLFSTALYLMDYETGKQFVKDHNATNPDQHIDVFWLIDESNDTDFNHADFKTLKEFPELKYAMTEGLQSSAQINK